MNAPPIHPPPPFTRGKRRRALLWALARRIVPAVEGFDESAKAEFFDAIDTALADRPSSVRRQFGLFLRVIQTLAILTRLRPLGRLPPESQDQLLASIEQSRFALLRKGFWGLKTLLAIGCYTQPRMHAALGYAPRPRGGGLSSPI